MPEGGVYRPTRGATLGIYFSRCAHKAAQNRVVRGRSESFSVQICPPLSSRPRARPATVRLRVSSGKQATCAKKHNRKALGLPVGLRSG